MLASDIRTVILDRDESDSPGPTVRNSTRPTKPVCGPRDPDRRRMIESPLKIKINTRKRDCQSTEQNDRMDTSSDLESEHSSVSQNGEVICLDDEPKMKYKNEFLTFEQIEENPDMDTVTNLLIYGIDATVEAAKKRTWPPLTKQQETSLRKTYRTLTIAVPIVRAIDKKFKL